MNKAAERPLPEPEETDPALERIQQDRQPGEMETAMMSGSDEGEISATERFEGEMTPEEALQALAPREVRVARGGVRKPRKRSAVKLLRLPCTRS